jgi:hypothetical protein
MAVWHTPSSVPASVCRAYLPSPRFEQLRSGYIQIFARGPLGSAVGAFVGLGFDRFFPTKREPIYQDHLHEGKCTFPHNLELNPVEFNVFSDYSKRDSLE